MNILEQEDLIKGATDDILLREAQSPTGSVPQFLVVSEIQRRKEMRNRFSTQDGQPEQSVAEQIVAEATPQMPPQGIGALQPQASSMPMQAPQMPPEMMVAQNAPMTPQPQMMAAGGGRMPYRRMADGGIVPPNSLVEDASKFNPENLYDMDASQMAMASPTNMGIASVLPMAGGGVVKMDEGGRIQAIKDMASKRYYGDDDNFNYGTALLDAASFIPVGGAAALGGRAIYRGGNILLPKLAKYLKSGVLQKKLKSGISSLGRETQRFVNPKTSPLMSSPKRILGTTAAYEGILNLPRLLNKEEVSAEIKTPTNAIEQNTIRLVDNNNQQNSLNEANTFLENVGYASGGIIRMQTQGQVPSNFVSINDTATRLASYYEDNPNEIVTPEHLEIIVGQQSPNFVSELTSENAAEKMFGAQNNLDINSIINNQIRKKDTTQQNSNIVPPPEAPVLETRNIGSTNISNLLNRDQGTELKTARELLREQLNQEVEPYDPTELLLKSQERSDKRALSEALIALGAGISRGDIASGFEGAGKSVAGIRNKQEALQQELEVRRGEAQTQSEKDKIARNIQIAQADISAIESNEDRKDKLIGRQLQFEGLLQNAQKDENAYKINQFTADLAANKFVRSQIEFDETIAANFNTQEQLNFRAKLNFMRVSFQDTYKEIVSRGLYPPPGEQIKTSSEIQKEVEVARKRMFDSLDSLKEKGENYNPTKVEGLVKGKDGVYRSK